MFDIKLKGFKELEAEVDELIKARIPKFGAMALTEVAKGFREDVRRKLPVIFKDPTPFTMNSIFFTPATPQNMTAVVWFKDDISKGTPASKYLMPEVEGGQRPLKPYEKALQRFGALPYGYYTTPGPGVKLDKPYGNIPHSTIVQILTGVGALKGMSDTVFHGKRGGYKKRKNTENFFVVKVKHGGLEPGIYQRSDSMAGKYYGSPVVQGRRVKYILKFVKTPIYSRRFPFLEWGREYVDEHLPAVFRRLAAETLEFHKSKQ